jgi:hypothetical protein
LCWEQAFGFCFFYCTGGWCFINLSWFFVYALLLHAPGKSFWQNYLLLLSNAVSFLSMRNRNEAASLQNKVL